MKRSIVVVLVLATIGVVAYASSKTNAPIGPYDPQHFPIMGVSTIDLRDILTLLDEKKADQVLSIQVRRKTIEVQTGRIKGFVDGSGDSYEFEKVNGKWVIKNESQWISQQCPAPLPRALGGRLEGEG